MLAKFQKLFGPNPPRTGALRTNAGLDDMDLGSEDEEHRRQIARVKNKRRLVGLLAIVAAVAVLAPSVFEPNDMYARRGAKLEIPSLQDDTAAKVVPLNRPVKSSGALPTDIATADLPAAQSLKSANPVAAEAKPITTPEQKTTSPKDSVRKTASSHSTPDVKAVVKQAKQAAVLTQAQKPVNEPIRAVSHGRFFIQIVATSNRESAEKVASNLRKLGLPSYTEIVRRRGSDLWRVRVGRFATEEDARRALDVLALNAVSNGGVHTENK